MSSTLHITPIGHRGEVRFKLPVKAVFGEVLCDTDGSYGYPTEFGPEQAIEIVDRCLKMTNLYPGDRAHLEKVRLWASKGWHMMADWVH